MTPAEVFVVSLATGAMAEFGDKTQLLAALLSVRL
ncbi:MAG: TMEM165/GDT1 family protein, partial [Alphaproteobacteria bacterium]|nr:TMEM165/GDT1 family protein [Alphaproteobacteria bacterium]